MKPKRHKMRITVSNFDSGCVAAQMLGVVRLGFAASGRGFYRV
jgi:hypothetical protein